MGKLEIMFPDVKIITEEIKNKIEIVLIAHVREPRGYADVKQLKCDVTEHFSVDEFQSIYSGIVGIGFYIRSVFFNETDFIADLLNNTQKYTNTIVFNLARNGTGINKKTVIPSICDLYSVAYTTSSAFAMACARNKYFYCKLLANAGIQTPQTYFLEELRAKLTDSDFDAQLQFIKKPNHESASLGVDAQSIKTAEEHSTSTIVEHTTEYIYQQYIPGYECETPVFVKNATPFVFPPVGLSIESDLNILTSTISDRNEYGFFPLQNRVSDNCIEKISKYALATFDTLRMEHYGRVDFRISENEDIYIFDISTTPYLTDHSSIRYACNLLGEKDSMIFQLIICNAYAKYFL